MAAWIPQHRRDLHAHQRWPSGSSGRASAYPICTFRKFRNCGI